MPSKAGRCALGVDSDIQLLFESTHQQGKWSSVHTFRGFLSLLPPAASRVVQVGLFSKRGYPGGRRGQWVSHVGW